MLRMSSTVIGRFTAAQEVTILKASVGRESRLTVDPSCR